MNFQSLIPLSLKIFAGLLADRIGPINAMFLSFFLGVTFPLVFTMEASELINACCHYPGHFSTRDMALRE